MNTARTHHPVTFRAPHYVPESPEARTQIHRYFDDEFVPRFQQRLETGALEAQTFLDADRFNEHDNLPVLRLPVHRTFHVVSTEVACQRLGFPALDPQRIVSASFVIRRVGGRDELAWMLENGEAIGWRPAPTENRDPDLNRRLCRNGVLAPATTAPAYTGEEVHPLRASVVEDDSGRKHTVLSGFLPLGGFHYLREDRSDRFDDAALATALQRLTVPWPFDFRFIHPRRRFTSIDEKQIDQGHPTRAFAELLHLLVAGEHVGEANAPANADLGAFLKSWHFSERRKRYSGRRGEALSRESVKRARESSYSIWSYLEACAAAPEKPLVNWLVGYRKTGRRGVLPGSPGIGGGLKYDLFITSADALELRYLLHQRIVERMRLTAREIPVPKFLQGAEDSYQVVPLVHALDDYGREQVYWCSADTRSEPFRVAAPFDPEASRPSLIQVPSLKDLKRGIANGVSFLTPSDTMQIIDSLNVEDGVTDEILPDPLPPAPAGALQTVCSFSIPIVTVAALIVLMIIVSLLNFVLQWMPWVRVCIPMPTLPDEPKFP